MTKITQNIRSKLTAGIGAALISTLFVVAAVGPAQTATASAPTAATRALA